MHPVEVDDILSTLTILVDTREQPSERAKKRYDSFSYPYRRQKLDYGDYSASIKVNGVDKAIPVSIERKMSLDELASCFTRDRKRFEAEFERANLANAKMYLLVENASWESLINGRYRSKFNPIAYRGSILAWIARYNIKPIFCKSESSGSLINEILYREAKELLNNGFYD